MAFVKIKKCSVNTYWYKDLVGVTLKVDDNYDAAGAYIVAGIGLRVIEFSDGELLDYIVEGKPKHKSLEIFSLDLYQKGDHDIVTRDGTPVRFITFDKQSKMPIICEVGNKLIRVNGLGLVGIMQDPFDIYLTPKNYPLYKNVYRTVGNFKSQEEACESILDIAYLLYYETVKIQ